MARTNSPLTFVAAHTVSSTVGEVVRRLHETTGLEVMPTYVRGRDDVRRSKGVRLKAL